MTSRFSLLLALCVLCAANDASAATVIAVGQVVNPTVGPGKPNDGNADGGESKKLVDTGAVPVIDSKGTPDPGDDSGGAYLSQFDKLTMTITLKPRVTLADVGRASYESVHVTVYGEGNPGGLRIDIDLPGLNLGFPVNAPFATANVVYTDFVSTTADLDALTFTITNNGTSSVAIRSVRIALDADSISKAPLPPAMALMAGGLAGLGAVARRRRRT